MKQHGDEHWHGHREITEQAVTRLFREHAGPDGRIRGATQRDYFRRLDKGQEYADRPLAAGMIRNVAGSSLDVPYAGPGPTAHSAYVNGEAQREHFMADPRRSGPENMAADVGYIYARLQAARDAARPDLNSSIRAEMPHLGAAVHALQDSYSGAHAWRDDRVYDGDPTAPVRSFHVFTPAHAVGIDDGRNTHADEFDKPLAESGSTRAAVEATYRLLKAYEESQQVTPELAERVYASELSPMLTPDPAVDVNRDPHNPRWQAERVRRIALERASAEPGFQRERQPRRELAPAELNKLAGVLDQQRPDPSAAAPSREAGSGAETGRSFRERQGRAGPGPRTVRRPEPPERV